MCDDLYDPSCYDYSVYDEYDACGSFGASISLTTNLDDEYWIFVATYDAKLDLPTYIGIGKQLFLSLFHRAVAQTKKERMQLLQHSLCF